MTLRPLLSIALLAFIGVALTGLAVVSLVMSDTVRTRVVWALRITMVWALLVVVAQPSTGSPVPMQEEVTNADILIVVDRTGSMAAEDWDGSQTRFDGVRADIGVLVDSLPGVRWSALTWDSEPVRTLPFTTDAQALLTWSEGLRQEITNYSSGSVMSRPVDEMVHILTQDKERHPEKRRFVIFISDGETTGQATEESLEPVRDLIDGGVVLGYGTQAGGRMRSFDGSAEPDPDAPWIEDDSGQPAISRIDEAALQDVATQLGVGYLHRTGPDPKSLDDWADGLAIGPELVNGREATAWLAVAWPAAVVLVLAGVSELILTEQGLLFRRRRSR